MKSNRSLLMKLSPIFWAVTIGIAVQLFAPQIWWHPDCNLAEPFNQSPAAGLPLPYVQRSVATSDIFYMPSVLALNVVLVTAVALPLGFFLVRRLARTRRAQLIQGVTSVIAFSVLLGLLLATLRVLEPTSSIASSNESYFDYRPVFTGFKTTPGSRCIK